MMKNNGSTAKNHVILFMDVHDFSIVFKMLGKNSYDFLQEVYEKLGDIIVEYKGEIIKYMGDAILCVFPADSDTSTVTRRSTFARSCQRSHVGQHDMACLPGPSRLSLVPFFLCVFGCSVCYFAQKMEIGRTRS